MARASGLVYGEGDVIHLARFERFAIQWVGACQTAGKHDIPCAIAVTATGANRPAAAFGLL